MTTLALRPYQNMIVDHIATHSRCNLFVPMGMGKTTSTLTALVHLDLAELVFPCLVLAPLRVARSTWPEEVQKWPHLRHLRVSVITGTAAERRAALRRPADIYTMNYENLPWLQEQVGDDWPFLTVVSDESSKLKGFRLQQGGQRARALAKYAHKKVRRYIGLTGTPASNGLQDLWGQMWFVDGGKRLGRSFKAFTDRWFQSVQVGDNQHAMQLVPLAFAQDQIQDAVRDVCMSLKVEDWFDIAAPIRSTIYVELPDKVRAMYKDMEREFFMQIERNEVEAFNAAAKSMKLRQLTSGAVYVEGDTEGRPWVEVHQAKIEALESIVEEAGGMPVMVVYQFKSDLARLLKAFPRGYDMAKDDAKAFKAGKHPVGFAHAASLGHGVDGIQNVTNIIAFFAHDWNLEQRQQIIERIGPVRQAQAGHKRPVFIYDIVARGTVDELVLARHESKRAIQDILMDAVKKGRV